jgi:hypothetical protein
LEDIARSAARRRGLGDHRLLRRRAMARIGVAIWRRAAKMVRSCLPEPAPEEIGMLFGEWAGDSAPGSSSDEDA